jgi:hypothetical protein
MMNNEELIEEQIKIYQEERRQLRAKFWIAYICILFIICFLYYNFKG